MMNKNLLLLSIVVPVYNEEEVIEEFNRRLVNTFSKTDIKYEVIYVNDGSNSQTSKILRKIADSAKNIRLIELSRNFGHQIAVTAGLDYSSGEIVVVIDADLQDPPEIILQMIDQWRNGYKVVYGIRRNRKENIFKRMAYYSFYRLLQNFSKVYIPPDSGDFSLMDRQVVNMLVAMPERNRFVRGLRSWVGFKQIGIEYDRDERFAGKSKYSLSKLFLLASDGVVNFSITPINMISNIGLFLFVSSILAAIFLIIWRISNFKILGHMPSDVQGFTTLAVLLLFFSGVQLLSVGIIGQYIGRIYDESKQRPKYIVENELGFSKSKNNLIFGDQRGAQEVKTSGEIL